MTTPALSTALLHMLASKSQEQALEWARRVVRLRFEAGEYPLVSMLDEKVVESLARIELQKRG